MTQKLVSSLTTPLTPLTTEEDRFSWLRLYRSRRVGVSTFFRLLTEHGSAQAALDALPEIARAAGSNDYSPATHATIESEIRQGRKNRATLICFGDPLYPDLLGRIDDPPPILWAIGDTALLTRSSVAMVGARNASSLGERFARQLSGALGEAGYVVASGLARGIDAAAHDAALSSGTIAVLGGGVDVTYPRENAALQQKIAQTGVLLSEQPMGLAPQARHFPRRNRIISGIARGLVVVEAASRSGSLITARNALDQGRDVMAVPGHPFDGRAVGCNFLIRDGAALIRGVEDVLEVIGSADTSFAPIAPIALVTNGETAPDHGYAGKPSISEVHADAPKSLLPSESQTGDHDLIRKKILERLSPTPISEDQLVRDLEKPVGIVAPVLTDLEIDGVVLRHPGGMISRHAI